MEYLQPTLSTAKLPIVQGWGPGGVLALSSGLSEYPVLAQSRLAHVKLKVPPAHGLGWPCAGSSPVTPDAKHTRHAHFGQKRRGTEAPGPVGLAGQTQRTQEGKAGGCSRWARSREGTRKLQQQKSTLCPRTWGFGWNRSQPQRDWKLEGQTPGWGAVVWSAKTRAGLSKLG